jgi:molybdenum cofactor cytidylyltransferase
VKIAGVVLAAGSSTRLGRPKQTVMIGGETLVQRAVRLAIEAGLSPVILVAADEALIVAGAEIVLNEAASEGMASSIRCGVNAVQGCDGVVLMACDQPALSVEHLQALIAEPAEIAGSAYAGRVGVPAYFPKSSFEALLALEGDAGARELLRGVRQVPQENLSFDIDTKEDLARWQTQ